MEKIMIPANHMTDGELLNAILEDPKNEKLRKEFRARFPQLCECKNGK